MHVHVRYTAEEEYNVYVREKGERERERETETEREREVGRGGEEKRGGGIESNFKCHSLQLFPHEAREVRVEEKNIFCS